MKRCGIIAPAGREESAAAALKVHAWMRDRAIDVFCEGFLHDLLPDTGLLRRGVSVDAIVALGGDGTILRSVPYAAGREVPVLGINLGNKGFLAAAESDRLEEALEALLSGEAACDRRRLIHINGDDSLLALNDVGILRGGRQRLMSVRVSVDGEKVGVYRCDGILVATPTGSTGYALSAGGPIVMPGAACLEIVPVCAHCLQTEVPAISDTLPGKAPISVSFFWLRHNLMCKFPFVPHSTSLSSASTISALLLNHITGLHGHLAHD